MTKKNQAKFFRTLENLKAFQTTDFFWDFLGLFGTCNDPNPDYDIYDDQHHVIRQAYILDPEAFWTRVKDFLKENILNEKLHYMTPSSLRFKTNNFVELLMFICEAISYGKNNKWTKYSFAPDIIPEDILSNLANFVNQTLTFGCTIGCRESDFALALRVKSKFLLPSSCPYNLRKTSARIMPIKTIEKPQKKLFKLLKKKSTSCSVCQKQKPTWGYASDDDDVAACEDCVQFFVPDDAQYKLQL